MWSKPAPPSDSGNGTPVSPSSAAFLKSPRGKWPVSSSSFASGRTSDSANSRTLFCSSCCSSVSSRSTVAHSHSAKHLFELRILSRRSRLRESSERLGQAFIRSFQSCRVNAGFARYGHEVRLAHPAWQHVQMQMPNDARTRGAAEIHSQVHAIGFVAGTQRCFRALRKLHHLAERRSIAQIQFRNVRVGNNHHVHGGVGETIQDDKCFLAPMDDQSLRIIVARHRIAKNAFRLVSACSLFHVLVAPGSPDIVHRIASFFEKLRAQHNAELAREYHASANSAWACSKTVYVF